MSTFLIIAGVIVLVFLIIAFTGKKSQADVKTVGTNLSAAGKAVGQVAKDTVSEIKTDVSSVVSKVEADLTHKTTSSTSPVSGSK